MQLDNQIKIFNVYTTSFQIEIDWYFVIGKHTIPMIISIKSCPPKHCCSSIINIDNNISYRV